MTLNIKLLSLLLVLLVNIAIAQTTAIPDQNFEQALIDLNIDSDGVVNGQVLTADISGVTVLDFGSLTYEEIFIDITGIEDFLALEVLDFADQGVYLYDPSNANVFSNNINLRELIMTNDCGDCGGVHIQILDLSGLPNLELVDLTNVEIETLIINNPNFDLTNLSLSLYHEGFPGGDWTQHICIEVADPQAATNNQFPYNTWNIVINDLKMTYGFDDTCTLSITDFENINSISAYPNPVQDKLWLENPNQIEIDKAEIYNISGKLISSYSSVKEFIDVQALNAGVYFVKVYGENSSSTFKVLKH
jgi:hypothetical protein